jgi:DNA-binding transcriptional MerR regulator/quercetin dioxygenase-like cupin family protein
LRKIARSSRPVEPHDQKLSPSAAPVLGESLKIGDVARRLGVSPSLVRAWERLGLARPARTDSKYRLYTKEDLAALRRAVYLRRVEGLNAAAIVRQLKQEGLLREGEPPAAPDASLLGHHLRKLRLQRGEPLSTVAEAVGVSIGFLSNLERSQSGASIGIMRRLAQYYGLNILDFFDPLEARGPLVRPKDRKVLEGGPGVQMELLASGKTIMEPHLFRIEPEAGSGESYAHEGEEFLFVIRGQLQITLENQQYLLRSGDSFYFRSETPHHWSNPGETTTLILWVNTPPTF